MASVSAASVALPLALQSISHDETALLRNLFWPDTLTPYITFSLVFIGVIPALLGYYHLGRLGFLLNIAAGFALAWIIIFFVSQPEVEPVKVALIDVISMLWVVLNVVFA